MKIAHGFTNAADLAAYHAAPRQGHRYGRDSSPEVVDAERAIEAYHPGYEAVLFSSGMAATGAVFNVFGNDGIELPEQCYRKNIPLAGERARRADQALRFSPHADFIVGGCPDVDSSLPIFRDGAPNEPIGSSPEDDKGLDYWLNGLVWAESPSNPHLRLADYEALQNDGRLIGLDLTFAGLGNFNGDFPDFIVHSLTKYACGHNDFMAGVVLAKGEHAEAIWKYRSYAGGIPDPATATMLLRSLKTYDIRIERQVRNTRAVLDWLLQKRAKVFYPSHSPWHDHGSAVVSFRIDGADPVELTDTIGAMKTVTMAPSFGAVDTMAEVPATMSRAPGVEPDLVRLSVGIEPIEKIIADLETLF